MILSTNQFHRDYDDSPELRAVCVDVPSDTYTVMTEEEAHEYYMEDLHRRAVMYADEYDCSYDAAWCAITAGDA